MILPLSALFAAGHALFRARGFAAREIASGGRRVLVYDKRGSGSAPPLLLLHGLGGSAASFALLASRLPSASRRVLVVDLPGHGRNRLRKGEEPAGLLEQAQALVSALAELDEPGVLIGNRSAGRCACTPRRQRESGCARWWVSRPRGLLYWTPSASRCATSSAATCAPRWRCRAG